MSDTIAVRTEVSQELDFVAEMALLVARTGTKARYLKEDNTIQRGGSSIEDAALSGGPFFVELAPWILALDADNPEAVSAAAQIGSRLEAVGFDVVKVASGRAGNTHTFVVLNDPMLHTMWAEHATSAGIDVRRFIRPPLAPHRDPGLSPELLNCTPTQALNALAIPARHKEYSRTPAKAAAPPPQASSSRPLSNLSTDMKSLLETGTNPQRSYESHSELVQALCTAAVNCGWDYHALERSLIDTANAGGIGYRSRRRKLGKRAAVIWLQRCWKQAQAFVAAHPPERQDRIDAERFEVLRWIVDDGTVWQGREGNSDRLVMLALLDIAQEQSTFTDVAASLRDLHARSGKHTTTVATALQRLYQTGWLTRIRRQTGAGDRANEYTISETPPLERIHTDASFDAFAKDPATNSRTPSRPPGREGVLTDYGHDAFTHSRGSTALRDVLKVLQRSRSPQTCSTLSTHTGWSYQEVSACLRLVRSVPCGVTSMLEMSGEWVYELPRELTAKDLDLLADAAGGLGCRASRRYELEQSRAKRAEERLAYVAEKAALYPGRSRGRRPSEHTNGPEKFGLRPKGQSVHRPLPHSALDLKRSGGSRHGPSGWPRRE